MAKNTMTNNTVDATASTFQELALSSKVPVAVDFWAPWCPHCVQLGPILEELAESMEGEVKFVKVNVDDEPALAERYGISSIPTVKLFCSGREIGAVVGAPTKSKLEVQIRQITGGHRECLASSSPSKQ